MLMDSRSLVIASGNAGKVEEFRKLLSGLPIKIEAQPAGIRIEETGTTFAENAKLKAITVAKQTNQWALADDSGLSVVELGGAPGIYSSRYANNDKARIQRLLEELGTRTKRDAYFCAALCIAAPNGEPLIQVEGQCQGMITTIPRGSNGFGYDPIFEVAGTKQTFAEMSEIEKKVHGHRGKAFTLLEPKLRNLLGCS